MEKLRVNNPNKGPLELRQNNRAMTVISSIMEIMHTAIFRKHFKTIHGIAVASTAATMGLLLDLTESPNVGGGSEAKPTENRFCWVRRWPGLTQATREAIFKSSLKAKYDFHIDIGCNSV